MTLENYSLKNYLEICTLIIHHSVKTSDFIERFKLNYYKFSLDFNRISQMAPFYGIHVFIEEKCLTYQIVDEALFLEKRGACVSFYHRNKRRRVNNISLIGTIGEMILQNKDAITIDLICQKVNASRSGLRHDLKTARSIIETYGIQVKNSPYKGLVKKGNEFNIRLALLTFLGFSERQVIIEDWTSSLYHDDFDFKSETVYRYEIEKVFKCFNIQMSNTQKRRLAKYIIIQIGRIKKEGLLNYLDLGQCTFDELMKTTSYQASIQIYQTLGYSESLNEWEILSLTLLILVFKEETDDCDFFASIQEKVDNTVKLLEDYYQNQWGFILNKEERELLILIAKKLCLNACFGFLSFRGFQAFASSQLYDYNPMLYALLHQVHQALNDFFQCTIRKPFLNDLAYLLVKKLNEMKIDYQKVKLYVLSSEGNCKAQLLKQMLENNLDKRYIESICVIQEEEKNQFTQQNQLLIYDRSAFNEQFVVLEDIDHFIPFLEHCKQVIKQKITLQVPSIEKRRIALNEKEIETILRQCSTLKNEKSFYRVFNGILVVFNPNQENKIFIGELNKSILVNRKEYASAYLIVYYSLDSSYRLLSEMIACAVKKEEAFHDFMELSIEDYCNQYCKYLIE